MVTSQWEGWTMWWWIMKETDGICSVRGLNHEINNGRDWRCLVSWRVEGWTMWLIMTTDRISSVSFTVNHMVKPSHWKFTISLLPYLLLLIRQYRSITDQIRSVPLIISFIMMVPSWSNTISPIHYYSSDGLACSVTRLPDITSLLQYYLSGL